MLLLGAKEISGYACILFEQRGSPQQFVEAKCVFLAGMSVIHRMYPNCGIRSFFVERNVTKSLENEEKKYGSLSLRDAERSEIYGRIWQGVRAYTYMCPTLGLGKIYVKQPELYSAI